MYIEKSVKINIIGDPNVGKSSFVYALFNHSFEPNQKIESIDPEKSITFIHSNYNFQLSFVETCGSNTSCYETIKNCNAVILFFSLIDKNTFENVDIFMDAYKSSYPNNEIPIILVGTKKDQLNQNPPNIDEIEMLKIPYYEVCASDIESIYNLLKSLLDPIIKKDKLTSSNDSLNKQIESKQQKKKDKKDTSTTKEKRSSKDKKDLKDNSNKESSKEKYKLKLDELELKEQIQDQQVINDNGASNNIIQNNSSDLNNNIIEFNELEIKEINLTNDDQIDFNIDKKEKKKGFFSLFRLKRKSNSTNQINNSNKSYLYSNNNSSTNNLLNNNNNKINTSSTLLSSNSSSSNIPISPRNNNNSNNNNNITSNNTIQQQIIKEDIFGSYNKEFSQQCGSLKKLNDKKDINNIKSFEYEIEHL